MVKIINMINLDKKDQGGQKDQFGEIDKKKVKMIKKK